MALLTTSSTARLSITVVVNLMDSHKEGFGGSTTVAVLADRDGFSFKYRGIELEKIRIDIVKKQAYELHGLVAFAKDDGVYGNGFRGQIDATFGGKIRVEAVALFGKVDDLRYFFVDAMLTLPPPGLVAGPLKFYGFGGGLYYHMKQKAGKSDLNSLGASRSGLVYEPNDSISIGIMAEVKFGVVSEKLIDSDVKFEIVFNPSGGLNRIGFVGISKCIVPGVDVVPDQIREAAQKLASTGVLDFNPFEGVITSRVSMQMLFDKDIFHAEMETYMNMGPVMSGLGPQGQTGKYVMHIEPDKWYIHLGTPDNPMGIKLLSIIRMGGYFMMGDDVPAGIPLNPTVASILHISPQQAAVNRNNDKLSSGKGIAFGASFDVNTGDLSFMCFYASFEVGAGFDINMIGYPKDAYCAGHSAPLGVNGWYAKGQAYAYLKGEIGMQVKLLGRRKKFEILDIAAAVVLRAEGPNPVYLEGQAGGKFSILGGMIKGQCSFKVTYGEKCQLVMPTKHSPVEDIQMIAAITPNDNEKDIDVFTTPQVVFNIPVNKEFNITDDITDKVRKFKATLDKLNFTKGDEAVKAFANWNQDHSTLAIGPEEILDPEAEYHIEAELSFSEYKDGKWETVTDDAGAKIVENKKCKFVTDKLPKKIPANAVGYSYPLEQQYNFYPKEYPEGYVSFSRGLQIYFNPGADWKQVIRFTPAAGGKALTSALSYNPVHKKIAYAIPAGLECGKIYSFEIVNLPAFTNNVDRNVKESTTNTRLDNDSNATQKRVREATGTITEAEENVLYSFGFRTSKYKTFGEKLSFTNLQVNMLYDLAPYVYQLQATIQGEEMFDKYEIYGQGPIPPLIRRKALLDETPWYKQAVEPVIYKDYPLLGKANITWRNTYLLGIPPAGEVRILQLNYDHLLTYQEMTTGIAGGVSTWAHLMYTLPEVWSKDYQDIRTKLANLYPTLEHPDEHIRSMLKKIIWPVVDKGKYPVTFEYVLPGSDKVTSAKTLIFNNPFGVVQPGL